MNRLLAGMCRVISIVQFLALATMTTVMISLVFTRYVMSFSPSWTEEVTRYLMIWAVMLGAAVLTLFDDHITLHILEGKLGPRMNLLRMLVIRLVVLGVCLVTGWTGIEFVQQMSTVKATGLGISMGYATLPVPISMWLMSLTTVVQIFADIAAFRSRGFELELKQTDYMDGSFRPAEDE